MKKIFILSFIFITLLFTSCSDNIEENYSEQLVKIEENNVSDLKLTFQNNISTSNPMKVGFDELQELGDRSDGGAAGTTRYSGTISIDSVNLNFNINHVSGNVLYSKNTTSPSINNLAYKAQLSSETNFSTISKSINLTNNIIYVKINYRYNSCLSIDPKNEGTIEDITKNGTIFPTTTKQTIILYNSVYFIIDLSKKTVTIY